MVTRRTRLAPSPTGALHLGNARTFLLTWAIARKLGWELILRMEDLDGPRIKQAAAEQALTDLAWLGLEHDGPVTWQSADLEPYVQAMRRLAAAGRTFPCALTRSEIEAAASAPHAGDRELRFPPELRPDPDADRSFADRATSHRFEVPDEPVPFVDELHGPCTGRPHEEVGDFVVWTQRGTPAYQLAVVVDDARQGVTDVVRGDDLLPSTARQLLLYRALGLAPPRWWHLPLVVGPDGRRLAKRHGDTRVASYREADVPAARIVGLLAWWSGLVPERRPMTAEGFLAALDLNTLSRATVTFTAEDDAWLRDA